MDFKEFFIQKVYRDPIIIVKGSYSSPADKEGRKDIGLGKVKYFCKLFPIFDLIIGFLLKWCPSYDKAIIFFCLYIFIGRIKFFQVVLGMPGLVGVHIYEVYLYLEGSV